MASWRERVKTGYVITMGDGARYTPKWLSPSVAQEFNISLFHYPNVDGTDAARRRVKGNRYNIELYFDGADHLDVAAAFRTSAANPKAWTITHPLYDTLVCQPLSLNYDNKDANVTKITGTVIETIRPKTKQPPNATDKLLSQKIQVQALQANSYTFTVVPTTADVREYKGDITKLYNEGNKGIANTLTSENYFNLFTSALTKVDNLVSEPLAAIRQIQAMIEAPYLFFEKVQTRVQTFASQIDQLRNTIDAILNPNQKRRYETNVGGILSGMAGATVANTDGSYTNRTDILNVADIIRVRFNQFIEDLDSLQTLSGSVADSYIPDFDSINALQTLVLDAIDNLFDILADGRIEMQYTVPEDTNVIELTYLLYGDDPTDEKLAEFCSINNIGSKEFLNVEKGTTVIYYS